MDDLRKQMDIFPNSVVGQEGLIFIRRFTVCLMPVVSFVAPAFNVLIWAKKGNLLFAHGTNAE
jgi:hypothetical protein